jgi:hypothetical protein
VSNKRSTHEAHRQRALKAAQTFVSKITFRNTTVKKYYVALHEPECCFIVCGITEIFSGESHAYITLASGCALICRPPSFGVSRGLKGPSTFHDIRAGSAIPTKASPRQDTNERAAKGSGAGGTRQALPKYRR